MNEKYKSTILKIYRRDPRYHPQAYDYVLTVVSEIMQEDAQTNPDAPPCHISGAQLAHTIGEDLIYDYGPMARSVLREWGVKSTMDFGNIVYNLIAEGMLSASEGDRPEDFKDVYDFHEAFDAPYEPPFPPPYKFQAYNPPEFP